MHDLRCEYSASDPKRCQCTECGGAKHGVRRPADGQLRTFTAAELMEFDDRTLDALEKVTA